MAEMRKEWKAGYECGHTAERLLRLCRRTVWLDVFSRCLAILACPGGAIILTLRYLEAGNAFLLPAVFLLPLLALIPAGAALARMKFDSQDAAAYCDRISESGGLFMAACEGLPLGNWKSSPAAAAHGKLHFHADCRKAILLCLGAFLFTGLCLWIPMPERRDLRRHPAAESEALLNVGSLTREIAGNVEILKETGSVDPQHAETLDQLLESLEHNAAAYEPARIFETLDSVGAAVQNLSDSAARRMLETGRLLRNARLSSAAFEIAPSDTANADLRRRAAELSEALSRDSSGTPFFSGLAAEFSPGQGGEHSAAGAGNLLSSSSTDSAAGEWEQWNDPQELAEALKSSGKKLEEAMKKLSSSGALSRERAEELRNFLEEFSSALDHPEEFLEEGKFLTREELEQLYGNTCRCTQPGCPGGPDCPAFPAAGRNTGSGSPSRGPGEAPLIYTPSDTQVTEGGIREKLRSESLRRIPDEQLGLSFSAPEVFRPGDNSYGSAGGSLLREPGSAVPGGENRGMRLSPRDRRTVGKFFRDAVE